MNRRTMYCPVLTALTMAVCAGCTPKMTLEGTKQTQSRRPAELDKLSMFEGRWVGTGEAKIAGLEEVLPVKGAWQAGWECDGWYLVSREEVETGESDKTKGLGIWTWDPARKEYRTWWYGSGGARVTATTTLDEATRTWILKFKAYGPSGSTVGRGCVKMVDDDTMEWSWVEWPAWDVLRLFKSVDLTGTYKRE